MQLLNTPTFEVNLNPNPHSPTMEWRSTYDGGNNFAVVEYCFKSEIVKHADNYFRVVADILDCDETQSAAALESESYQQFKMRPVDRFFQLQADTDLESLANLKLLQPGLCDSCQQVYPADYHDVVYSDTELEFPLCGACGHYCKYLPSTGFAFVWANKAPLLQDGRNAGDEAIKVYNRIPHTESGLSYVPQRLS